MTEEEKEAIERQKNNIEIVLFETRDDTNGAMYITMQDLKIILNYIDKLQKENQEYHRIKKDLIRVNKKIYDVDTIDEFIETIDKLQKENTELKEENQRIKDINVELNTDVSAWKTTVEELRKELKE